MNDAQGLKPTFIFSYLRHAIQRVPRAMPCYRAFIYLQTFAVRDPTRPDPKGPPVPRFPGPRAVPCYKAPICSRAFTARDPTAAGVVFCFFEVDELGESVRS